MEKFLKIIKNPFNLIISLGYHGFFHFIPDELWLKIIFRIQMGYKLNLNNPQTFNEKLQWLKLHNRNPLYTKLVDKYEVKKIVADIIGEEYIIPTLGVWDKFDDINFDELPDQFVLKCTHDSGGLVICKDKSKLDIKAAKKKINTSLKRNYFWGFREWPYKNVKPRIIAERYIEDSKSTFGLIDYKFLCFDGIPKLMFTITDRDKKCPKSDYYDIEFNHLDIEQEYPCSKDFANIKKPLNFDKMIAKAKLLTKEIPHCRADFYEIDGKFFFGELTFSDSSGFADFKPNKWNKELGNLINLRK